jgi:hypothetical protein
MAGPNVRLVDGLKAEAAAYAAGLGISLNALVAVAVREYLDSKTRPHGSQSAQGDPREAKGRPEPPANTPPDLVSPAPALPASMPRAARPRLSTPAASTVATSGAPRVAKVGRNDPCPCGSGRKAKACHPEHC